ncbi:ribosomal protein L18e, partial [Aureobasidium melanogenum]
LRADLVSACGYHKRQSTQMIESGRVRKLKVFDGQIGKSRSASIDNDMDGQTLEAWGQRDSHFEPHEYPNSNSVNCLHLETLRASATTGTLELATLALDEDGLTCLVRVGTEAEVLDGLTGVLGATEEEGVGTGRGAHGQLIDGQGLTTSGDNAGAGSVGVAEGGNRELGELKETVVVSDGADQDDGLALVSLAGVLVGSSGNDLGERHGRAVDLAHHQATEDSGVELAVVVGKVVSSSRPSKGSDASRRSKFGKCVKVNNLYG